MRGSDASPLYTDPFLLGQFYAAPYFFYNPEYCFTLVSNRTGKPEGYILGTGDTNAFDAWRNTAWLPPILETCKKQETDTAADKALKKRIQDSCTAAQKNQEAGKKEFTKAYPAHFHIDIMPELQKQGWGSKLLAAFSNSLIQNKIYALHLGVDKQNAGAVSFYSKSGCTVLGEDEYTLYFGKKLNR